MVLAPLVGGSALLNATERVTNALVRIKTAREPLPVSCHQSIEPLRPREKRCQVRTCRPRSYFLMIAGHPTAAQELPAPNSLSAANVQTNLTTSITVARRRARIPKTLGGAFAWSKPPDASIPLVHCQGIEVWT